MMWFTLGLYATGIIISFVVIARIPCDWLWQDYEGDEE